MKLNWAIGSKRAGDLTARRHRWIYVLRFTFHERHGASKGLSDGNASSPEGGPPHHQRGSAVLVVLVLVALMAALIVCNTRVLDNLKGELRLLEEKQKVKFAPAPVPQKPKQP